MTAERAINLIKRERRRQEHLCKTGKFKWTCAAPRITNHLKLAVLAEEFGEVSKEICEMLNADSIAIHEQLEKNMRTELVEVAAVCLAWLESL